jgi:LysR family transcriptional regulator, glycine cleavage system transcriptional activator
MTLPHTIPLQALRVFEAAARHCNMVRAAAELGVTQGAVSRQIKALEDRLHAPLFRRTGRGLALTEAGDLLADYVSRGFGQLADGLYRIGQPRQRGTLVVTASRTFALRVLAPRVGEFVRRYPWIDLRIDSHRYFTDLRRSDADIAIRAGDGAWPGHVVLPLTREQMFPVCAPDLAAAYRGEIAAFLRAQVMLHYAERPYWPDWLAAAGLEPALGQHGPRFGETALALAAAEAGQGVAVSWAVLVADALAAGRLVRPFNAVLDNGTGYHLVMTPPAAARSTAQLFCEWLQQALGTRRQPETRTAGP